MARFELTAPHYLNVAGNQWEYKEVDRTTGKEKRHLRDVPIFLHPEDQSSWNYITERLPNGQIADGKIIVSTKEDPTYPKDIVFIGPPTMDMLPLDDEAKVLIATLQGKWKHPIDPMPGDFAQQLPMLWQQQIELAKSQQSSGAPNVSTRELEELRQQNKAMQDKLAELEVLIAAVASAPPPQAQSLSRRQL